MSITTLTAVYTGQQMAGMLIVGFVLGVITAVPSAWLAGRSAARRRSRDEQQVRRTVARSQRRRRAVEALRDAHEYPALRSIDPREDLR